LLILSLPAMVETGCSNEIDVSTCTQNHTNSICCTSYNETQCIYNYKAYTSTIEVKILITFALLFFLMVLILALCFSEM